MKYKIENLDKVVKKSIEVLFLIFYIFGPFFYNQYHFLLRLKYIFVFIKKNNSRSYESWTFFKNYYRYIIYCTINIIYQICFNKFSKKLCYGINVFFPQFIVSIISIIVINNQDFITKEEEENEYQNKMSQLDDIMDFVNNIIINSGNDTDDNNFFKGINNFYYYR